SRARRKGFQGEEIISSRINRKSGKKRGVRKVHRECRGRIVIDDCARGASRRRNGNDEEIGSSSRRESKIPSDYIRWPNGDVGNDGAKAPSSGPGSRRSGARDVALPSEKHHRDLMNSSRNKASVRSRSCAASRQSGLCWKAHEHVNRRAGDGDDAI